MLTLKEKIELLNQLYNSDDIVAETYDIVANFSLALGMTIGVIIMLVFGAFK
jgi:hypothetical protein